MARLDSLLCRREAAKKLSERFQEYIPEPIRVVWNYDNASDNYNFLHDIKERIGDEDESAR